MCMRDGRNFLKYAQNYTYFCHIMLHTCKFLRVYHRYKTTQQASNKDRNIVRTQHSRTPTIIDTYNQNHKHHTPNLKIHIVPNINPIKKVRIKQNINKKKIFPNGVEQKGELQRSTLSKIKEKERNDQHYKRKFKNRGKKWSKKIKTYLMVYETHRRLLLVVVGLWRTRAHRRNIMSSNQLKHHG